MNNYETVFIVTPVLSDAQVQEVADKFQGVITENGGQIVNKESWGLKKLAYPIQKKTTGFTSWWNSPARVRSSTPSKPSIAAMSASSGS